MVVCAPDQRNFFGRLHFLASNAGTVPCSLAMLLVVRGTGRDYNADPSLPTAMQNKAI